MGNWDCPFKGSVANASAQHARRIARYRAVIDDRGTRIGEFRLSL
jgi:hypothetical protein